MYTKPVAADLVIGILIISIRFSKIYVCTYSLQLFTEYQTTLELIYVSDWK